jgi:ABC-2 type transport system permease protein
MIRDALRLFVKASTIKLVRAMQYRANFAVGLAVALVQSLLLPAFQLLLFTSTAGFVGWTIDQVLLFQSVMLLFTGLARTLFDDVFATMSVTVKNGDFDRVLLLPHAPLVTLLTSGFSFPYLGSAALGLAGSVYFAARAQTGHTLRNLGLAAAVLLVGLVFYVALVVFYCAFVLTWIEFHRVRELLDKVFFFSSFPAEGYSRTLRFAYLFLFPVSIWAYYPAQILLDRAGIHVLVAMAAGIALFAASVSVWNHRLGGYTSAGG